jgi:hypothetical protein
LLEGFATRLGALCPFDELRANGLGVKKSISVLFRVSCLKSSAFIHVIRGKNKAGLILHEDRKGREAAVHDEMQVTTNEHLCALIILVRDF